MFAPRGCLKAQSMLSVFCPKFLAAGICIAHLPSMDTPSKIKHPRAYGFYSLISICNHKPFSKDHTRLTTIMEQNNKLAEIKLVSKYYPVGNYSYPRKDDGTLLCTIRTVKDRTSLGSEGSAPGLIDDRSDSEVSQEDDYQYHANTSELWDSFWHPGREDVKDNAPALPPKKQYPALIPSPQHRRQRSGVSDGCQSPSWPLPDALPLERTRKAAATYSPFPTPRPAASRQQPRKAKSKTAPQRPPRPDHLLLTPCIEQPASVPITFVSSKDTRTGDNIQRPKTSAGHDIDSPRLTKSLDGRPPSMERRRSSTHLRPSSATAKQRGPRSHKSTSHLAGRRPEPQSFFDFDDSDSEESPTSNSKSFFRFHKRTDSDSRHSDKSEAASSKKLRHRADTLPASHADASNDQSHSGKKRQADVFGRMLGRLSR